MKPKISLKSNTKLTAGEWAFIILLALGIVALCLAGGL